MLQDGVRLFIERRGNVRRARGSFQAIEYLVEQSGCLLLPLWRHLRLLVLMLRVAHDAASLLNCVVDHRHDGVIGNAALARTVIVQHVTGA